MSNLREMPNRKDFPELVTVQSIERELNGKGYLMQFSCGHIVWTSIEPKVGEHHYCGECLNLTRAARIPGPRKTTGTEPERKV